RTPVANPLLGAAIMTVVAIISGQPTLGGQFSILVGVTAVLSLVVYGFCSAALLRLGRSRGARLVAVGGLLFASAAVAAAAPGYVLPTAGFFARTTAGWFLFLRKSGR